MRNYQILFAVLVAEILLEFAASGQAGPPIAVAAHVTTSPPEIDGVLSAGEWENTEEIILPGGNPTVVRAEWSETGLYFSLKALDTTPFIRKPGLEAEGSLHMQDVWEIFIDVLGDARQYYEVQIALSGETYAKNHLLTAPPEVDETHVLRKEFWCREWWPQPIILPADVRASSRYDPMSGWWTAEIFLPAGFVNKRRGGCPLSAGVIRLNLVRHDWKNATDADFLYWAPVKSGHPHLSPTVMGTLRLEGTSGR
ncbi:hypothetical protein TSACC_3499 [Terrimicrobium sacchariphilum]|uniref:Carbohydrate-binding domain-containing protein n=1 Tax=Terrimicrobium sacchariphilum TaxID=690879 RepID=A0A146GE89_TERSA|nr:hypothetical protein [Terrimicrobium sacchariphilum]GAT35433.1 hypothetical protein TSACC_3499 [Terrimicrobium sacchariphilum]